MSAGRTCDRCGAPAQRSQEYCLDCGNRLGSHGRPLHWLWPTAAAGIIAMGGAAIVIAAGAAETAPTTIVALTPLRSAPPVAAQSDGSLARWPRRDGYTIVLGVTPVGAGVDAAAKRARQAAATGLTDVGVLTSADFASLRPGSFVIFSGVYRTLDEAQTALPRARSKFRAAYTQQITR